MQHALAAYAKAPTAEPETPLDPPLLAEQFPAAARVRQDSCIHCHQVYDFRREALTAEKRWTRNDIFVYPSGRNIGIVLDIDRGSVVREVIAGGPAEQAGIRPQDQLERVAGRTVASFADLTYALHRAGKTDTLPIQWRRGAESMNAALKLPENWRESDISWRESMWGIAPQAFVYGPDLTTGEKQALGLGEKRLAFRQSNHVPLPAREAGIRGGDVILGVDDRPLEMTMRQFNAFVRLNYKLGDQVTFNVIRDGQRMNIPMVLADRRAF